MLIRIINSVADQIRDETETNMIAFRRTVYLTLNSSLDFEECAHKLLRMKMKPGQEVELCHMFLDCCTQQRTYEKFFGSLAHVRQILFLFIFGNERSLKMFYFSEILSN